MSRAQSITAYTKQPEVYSDFLSNLDKHPLSGDIGRVTNTESIKQSIKNLLLTNYGERFFNPGIGSNVYRTLFQPMDNFTLHDMKDYIKETLQFHEPRVNLIGVNVAFSENNKNTVTATIVFSLINSNNVNTLNLILQRVR
jgi:phage baseplate assembly protein W